MRLITHNLLVCNLRACVGRNIPLQLQAEEMKEEAQEFNPSLTLKMIGKLEWERLVRTAESLGFGLPASKEEIEWESESNIELLQLVHRLLFNVIVFSGNLICSECGRQYRIDRGIPNMVIEEEEIIQEQP